MIPRTSLVLVAFVLALAGCTERTQAPPAEGGGSAADRTQDPADGMDHDVPPQAGEDEPSNEDALAPGPHEASVMPDLPVGIVASRYIIMANPNATITIPETRSFLSTSTIFYFVIIK